MFERFTQRSRQVMVVAQKEARLLRHDYIGVEHILLGLLLAGEGVTAEVLASLNITVERVRPQVAVYGRASEEVSTGSLPLTPRAKKVLELAVREALSLGQHFIEPEHILLGLVRENEGVATHILLELEADSVTIRREVLRVLSLPRAAAPAAGNDAHIGPRTAQPSGSLVFLCHSSNDKEYVRRLERRLRTDGFRTWLDERELLPGREWEPAIRAAVREADVVVVCLSGGSINKSGYVQQEIRLVLDEAERQPEGAIFVIPAKIEPCEVPDRLSRWQWVDLRKRGGYNRLAAGIRAAASPRA